MINHTHFDIIRSPIVTEKATIMSESNKYVFEVACYATKSSIKLAVEKIFKVIVKSVNVMIRKGKEKKFKGTVGRRSDVKRAIVTIAPGQSLDLTAEV